MPPGTNIRAVTSLAEVPVEDGSQPIARAGVRDRVAAYVALTKPRIIELLLVTTVPTMLLAAHGLPPWHVLVATLVGGTLAAGSANALNCYLDRDIDQLMRRTRRRPLPRHAVTPGHAVVFGGTLAVLATVFMALTTNLLAAGLTAAAIAFYLVVYTMLLKRRTSQNVVWGGLAGCMPVVIGWSAVTGGLGWPALVLFAVVFFWTPPHTWALGLRYREDYAAAGVPMLPVVASRSVVVRRTLIYSWVTVAVSLLLWPLVGGPVYGALALVIGAAFLVQGHLLARRVRAGGPAHEMRFFHWSNTYLTLLFCAVALCALLPG